MKAFRVNFEFNGKKESRVIKAETEEQAREQVFEQIKVINVQEQPAWAAEVEDIDKEIAALRRKREDIIFKALPKMGSVYSFGSFGNFEQSLHAMLEKLNSELNPHLRKA